MAARPRLVVGGDPRHGVVRFAGQLAGAVRDVDGGEGAIRTLPTSGSVHLQFTDRLWGQSPAQAASRIEHLADHLTVTVTLHDVPQPSDGPARLPARIDGYRRVVACTAGVVCSSHHEAALLKEQGVIVAGADAAVIPLPIIDPVAPGDAPAPRQEVGLLGFFYPGKGHAEAVRAVAALDVAAHPAVVALGAVSPGHEAELAGLAGDARHLGVVFTATGWLEELALRDRAREVAVPLAAHRHISSSGSIGSWIAAGRRPLVADSRYARELDGLRPGTITRYDPQRLTEAIGSVLAGRTATWLQPGTATAPHLTDTARAYLNWWRDR
jgi:hypothetical protein